MPTTLYLTPRYTSDSIALWRAATARGWNVERLQSRAQTLVLSHDVAVYAEPFFALGVADVLGVTLLEPRPDWLATIPVEWTRRQVHHTTLRHARGIARPTFVKPADDKCFEARVYAQGLDLPPEEQLDGSLPVLTAEPVAWETEYRCFVSDGEVQTVSVYLRSGELAEAADGTWPMTDGEADTARGFARTVLSAPGLALPPAVALDVGVIRSRGWAVVEANPAWASGIYGCDPDRVLAVIREACVPRER